MVHYNYVLLSSLTKMEVIVLLKKNILRLSGCQGFLLILFWAQIQYLGRLGLPM